MINTQNMSTQNFSSSKIENQYIYDTWKEPIQTESPGKPLSIIKEKEHNLKDTNDITQRGQTYIPPPKCNTLYIG